MAGFSDAIEQEVLKNYFRNTAPTTPATVYVSLHTATLTDAGTGTEVSTSGTAYARASVTCGASGGSGSGWTVPSVVGSTYQTSNVAAIVYSSPTANWGTVTDFGIWTAVTSGTLIALGTLTVARTINSGDSAPQFAIGALTVSLD